MKSKTHDKIINKAVKLAAIGIHESDDDEGSSQINNLINMMQSDQSTVGIDRISLFIKRQNGRQKSKKPIISDKATRMLSQDIKELRDMENAPELVLAYLNYVKWGFDAVKRLDKAKKNEIARSENPLVKLMEV